MKDKKLFKKWWVWAIAAFIVIGVIGSFGQTGKNAGNPTPTGSPQPTIGNDAPKLPKLNPADYKNKEGLVVYKDLKGRGYQVDAEFGKQALTDTNGKASGVFESLDPNKTSDRQSVDAFVVSNLVQLGDSVKLTITNSPSR